MSAVAEAGYHVSPPPSTAASLSLAINHTLSALASAGWPPQFLLLYDETWALLADTIAQQYSSFGLDLILEADVNVWHLTRPVGEETSHEEASPSPSPIHPQIGSNFPNPHRDMVYSECHDDDEGERERILAQTCNIVANTPPTYPQLQPPSPSGSR